MKPLKKLLRADGGAQVIEYALLVSVVTLLLLIGLRPLAPSLCDLQQRVGQLLALGSAQACAGGGNSGGGGTGGGGGGGVGGGGSGGGGGGPGGGGGGGSGGGIGGGGGGGGSGAGRP